MGRFTKNRSAILSPMKPGEQNMAYVRTVEDEFGEEIPISETPPPMPSPQPSPPPKKPKKEKKEKKKKEKKKKKAKKNDNPLDQYDQAELFPEVQEARKKKSKQI